MNNSLKTSLTAILACVRQAQALTPKDLTADTEPNYPIFRTVWRTNTSINTDFNGSGRSPMITIAASRGWKIESIWVAYDLPAIPARELTDRVAFDSLPGLNALNQIEVTLSSYLQIETITNTGMIARLLRFFGPDLFRHYAIKHFGGYHDPITGYRGPLQKMTGISSANIQQNNISKNEIFPKIHILFPMPISFFFNNELFPFVRASEAPLDVKFVFRPYTNVLSYTKGTIIPELAGELSLTHINAHPVDSLMFYNKAPYGDQSTAAYFLVDNSSEFQQKSFSLTNELKMVTKQALTKRLETYVDLKHFTGNELFFGNTIEEAVKTQLGAMFYAGPAPNVTNPAYTINLNTGLFVSSGTANSGNLQIEGWVAGGTSFSIRWTRTQNSSSVVKINCSVPLDSFGNFYLDLATYAPGGSTTAGFSSITQAGIFFLLSEFTLDIRPYNAAASQDNINTREVPTLSNGPMKKLARGFFTFNPNINNVNQHAFFSILDYKRTPALTCDQNWSRPEFAFDFYASLPIPSSHSMNVLVEADTVRVYKNQHYFWDLDCKWPINIIECSLEKQNSSNTETIYRDELELYRDPLHAGKPTRWDAPLQISWSYSSRLNPRNESNGYMDMTNGLLPSFVIKLEHVKFYYDGVEFSDTLKEFSQTGQQRDINIIAIQWTLKMYQFYANRLRVLRSQEQIEPFNRNLLDQILIPNGWTSMDYKDTDYPLTTRDGDYAAAKHSQTYNYFDREPVPMPPPVVSRNKRPYERTYGDELSMSNHREYVQPASKIMRNSNVVDRYGSIYPPSNFMT